MFSKFILFPLICLLCYIPISAQEISTAVFDPNKIFEAMHWHPDGRIYALDYYNGSIYEINLNGSAQTIVSGLANIAGGGFGADGAFYYSSIGTGEVFRLNPDHSSTLIADGLSQPTGILQSPDSDTLYVAQYGNSFIAKVSIATGTVSNWVGGNGINGPDAIIFDGNGKLLVANFNDTKIHEITADGSIELYAELPESGYMGYLAAIEDGLYVPAFSGHRVYVIGSDQVPVNFVGTGTAGNQDGPVGMATFTQPNGICSNATGDTLLISDQQYIRMVTQFEPIVNKLKRVPQFKDLKVYPNPVSDNLLLSFSLDQGMDLQWKMYNSAGELVLSGNFIGLSPGENTLEINLGQLTPGIYQCRLFDKDRNVSTQSLIKIK